MIRPARSAIDLVFRWDHPMRHKAILLACRAGLVLGVDLDFSVAGLPLAWVLDAIRHAGRDNQES